jgi:hypothetical protein
VLDLRLLAPPWRRSKAQGHPSTCVASEKYMNVIYRLDTESARAFLGQFVTLP